MPKLTDAELIAAIEAEASIAVDGVNSGLADDRAQALARFKGLGPEAPEGRSAVVSRDLMDTIEWIMPSLARIYLGGSDIGRFEARGPEDEEAAKIETDVVNWYLESKNDSYTQLMATLKDALLLRNGYLLAWWEAKSDVVTETYTDLADEEAAVLLQDAEVKVVEHSERVDARTGATLHTVKMERERPEEFVRVESIPPDEILVSSRHRFTSLADVDFVQWRRRITIGELRAMGYEVADDAPGYYDDRSAEMAVRDRFGATQWSDDSTPDPARRVVTLNETWLRIDLRNSGQQQLWRVCHIAGTQETLVREEADMVPIAAFTGIVYPHSHVGTSIDDLVCDLADIKTVLTRQLLDNTYLVNNTEKVIDVTRANLDDFLIARPGGIKRIEGPVHDAFMPIVTPDVSGSILGALEYVDSIKEARTGVTRYSAGLDANSLNKTATGVQQIQAAANQRIELIARTLATGFKDLFCVMHALACKHSTKPLQIKLYGKWQVVDPRSWTKRTDFTVAVGLGTGTPEQQIMKLQSMMPFMQQGSMLGLVGPQEFFNWGAEYLKACGYRSPDKFLKQPQRDPQTGEATAPPPPPNPLVQVEQIKQQGKAQELQFSAQIETQKMQMQAQSDAQQAQTKAALDERATANQMAQEQRKAQMDYELRQQEAANKMQLEKYKADLQAETQIRMKLIEVAGQAMLGGGEAEGEAEPGEATEEADPLREAMPQLVQALTATMQQLTAAKRIVRDPLTGKATGIVSEPQQPLQ